MQHHRLVAVLGASGSGKSSLVFAGLQHTLAANPDWLVVHCRPGRTPFANLAAAFSPLLDAGLAADDQQQRSRLLGEELAQGDKILSDLLKPICQQQPDKTLLLIVDQFEELYTQNLSRPQQHQFVDCLLAALAMAGEELRLRLVLTLRADFLNEAIQHPALAQALDHGQQKILSAMAPKQLRLAMEQPAAAQSVRFQEGLAERILDNLGGDPGSLPLLEFALAQLWERQQDRHLTHQAYDAIGGVREALARHANAVMASEDFRDKQEDMRRVFIQLVRPGEGTEDTRQVAMRARFSAADQRLIAQLASARLIVTGRDEDQQRETVEVVHEALIKHWDILKGWMAQDRDFRVWQNRLGQALQAWRDSQQDEGALLRGALLAQAREMRDEHGADLSPEERAFIDASSHTEEAQQQRATTRLRRLLASAAVALVAISVIAVFAWQQQQIAERQRARAERRFNDVAQIANAFLFDFHDAIAPLAGSTPARALVVRKGQEYLRLLEEDATDNQAIQRALSVSHNKIGNIQAATGGTAGALSSYRQALTIGTRLAQADPTNAPAQRDVFFSYTKLGRMGAQAGEWEQALVYYRQALQIIQPLAEADQVNVERQNDLAWILEQIETITAKATKPTRHPEAEKPTP